jgi:hypothetical protein
MHLIDENFARLALTAVRAGRDPFGLAPHETIGWMDVRSALEGMLRGTRVLPDAPFLPFDADTARLVAACGVHPLALAILGEQRSAHVRLPVSHIKAYRERDHWECGIPVGRSGRWRGGHMTTGPLPATLIASVETMLPMPIREIVDHPMLADVRAEVVSVGEFDGFTALEFDERAPCEAADMIDIWQAAVAHRERAA